MKWLRRLLCRLGWHRWVFVNAYPFALVASERCSRCGARRMVSLR